MLSMNEVVFVKDIHKVNNFTFSWGATNSAIFFLFVILIEFYRFYMINTCEHILESGCIL